MQEDYTAAMEKIYLVFPILNNNKTFSECSHQECDNVLEFIRNANMESFVVELVIESIQKVIRSSISPKFWSYFESIENDMDGFERFHQAVDCLHKMVADLVSPLLLSRLEALMSLGEGAKSKLYGEISSNELVKVILRSVLHSQMPLNHQVITEHFYKVAFKVFCNADSLKTEANDSTEDVLQCGGCGVQVECCQCENIINVFRVTNRKLIELELLERICGEVLTSLIHKRIEKHIQETCQGSFDTSFIVILENWLQTVVMGWLSKIYDSSEQSPSNSTEKQQRETVNRNMSHVSVFKKKLQHLLYETYTRTRIEQLFNIIIEYPDSDPAIEDLRVCLRKTDLRAFLIQKLQRALETRLLHPGVNTPDIITAYVAAIKALRHLDPTGVMLETVTQPIRQYLRCRDDTVRCVITNLTEEGPSDLAEELVRGSEAPVDDHRNVDCDIRNWQHWHPDPVDADPSKSRRTSDIVSMLVNLYGSKDLFVNEYRTLLADRLLTQFNYNTEKEIRYLELLKLRFGDSQLHYCEVMLKDIYDSKRINAHLHSDPNFQLNNQSFPTTALILSAQFWPPFKDDSLELPTIVKERMAVYTKAFEMLKGNRTLNWKPHLGSVNLDIVLKDRTINLTVSPIQASIIWHFQTKSQWTIEELSQVLHIPATALRRKIAFWQSQGLLRETSTDCFLLIEESASRSKCVPINEMVCEDEEAESVMASAHDQREEELQVFWSYIVGMLTNLDSMPLERIHQMLKMFASQGPTSVECSLQELRHFLDRKVREHKLLFSGGFYRLPKS